MERRHENVHQEWKIHIEDVDEKDNETYNTDIIHESNGLLPMNMIHETSGPNPDSASNDSEN